ncbi:CB1 cannabinoid receptor-interacting protein 1 [Desmophyllum pertusum]|uniref:CB1 cannabinoid receptor-interacting protein 1 n=1 Tax=Desmophyllum pertusum TaxID=174260 RepID=A0A9W9YLM3_9CNID|nr:CB1 cannabinoid receptor-interacting protein 1 [Desmophyllum pertusum]
MASTRTEESAFKLDVNITKLEDSSPVFFKVDGERFKEIQTLKLQVDTTYRVSFEFRPSKEVSEISIAGGGLQHELKRGDERSSHYECSWSTHGMSGSKKKDRLYTVICVQVSRWQRTKCQGTVQDVFLEGQEPCYVGDVLEEPAD